MCVYLQGDIEKGLEMKRLVLSGFLASEEIYINQLEALLLVIDTGHTPTHTHTHICTHMPTHSGGSSLVVSAFLVGRNTAEFFPGPHTDISS